MKMRSLTLAVVLGCFLILGSGAILTILFLGSAGASPKTALKTSSDLVTTPTLKLKIRTLTLDSPSLTLELGTLDRDSQSLDPLFDLRALDLKKALEAKIQAMTVKELDDAFRGEEQLNPLYQEINSLLKRSEGEVVVFTLGRKR